jgi:hypothetical protein
MPVMQHDDALITNVKAPMSKEVQSSNAGGFVIWILSLICHLDLVIWHFQNDQVL